MLNAWIISFLSGCLLGRVHDFGYAFLKDVKWIVFVTGLLLWSLCDRKKIILVAFALLWAKSHTLPVLNSVRSDLVVTEKMAPMAESSSLFVSDGEHHYEVRGEGSVGSQGVVRCMPSKSFLSSRFCYFKERLTSASAEEWSLLQKFAQSLRDWLFARLVKLSLDTRVWIKSVLLGERAAFERETLRVFKNTGTYHLLVVSGLHLSFLAFFFHGLLRFWGQSLYVVRLVNPRCWITFSMVCDFVIIAALFLFTKISGSCQSAERAFCLFATLRLTPVLLGHVPLTHRIKIAFLLQSICFPHGILSEGSMMSWGSYLLFAHFSSVQSKYKSGWAALVGFFKVQISLSIFVAACIGTLSISGILVNPLIVPLFPLVLLVSMILLVIAPYEWVATHWLEGIIYLYVALTSELEMAFAEFFAKLPTSQSLDLSFSFVGRLAATLWTAYVFLNVLRDMSIRKQPLA